MNLQEILHNTLKIVLCAGVTLFLLAMTFSGIIHDWYTKQIDEER